MDEFFTLKGHFYFSAFDETSENEDEDFEEEEEEEEDAFADEDMNELIFDENEEGVDDFGEVKDPDEDGDFDDEEDDFEEEAQEDDDDF